MSPPSPVRAGSRCTSGSISGRSCPERPRTTDVDLIDEPPGRLDEGALRGFGRDLIPRVLAGMVRRGEDFDAAEDALQEALLEALRVWPEHPPRDPRAWLATVATRRARGAPPPGGARPHAGRRRPPLPTLLLLPPRSLARPPGGADAARRRPPHHRRDRRRLLRPGG